MAPLSQAIKNTFVGETDGKVVYRGDVDKDWTVISVPNGGFILGLAIDAVMKYQAGTPHPDPIHVTAHFMRSAIVGPYEVHIRTLKVGKGFKNLSVAFVQKNEDIVLTHMIFGTLGSPENASASSATLAPPSPYATRTPMNEPPSRCIPAEPSKLARWTFRDRMTMLHDPVYAARAQGPHTGMQWADYITLSDSEEQMTPPMLALFADLLLQSPITMSMENIRDIWLPTMVMTLEFKFPIPRPSDPHTSTRTVAVYSQGKFVNDPSARHDVVVEVWTAPPEGEVHEGWKEHQRCLAVSTQMALVVPAAVNLKKGGVAKAKL